MAGYNEANDIVGKRFLDNSFGSGNSLVGAVERYNLDNRSVFHMDNREPFWFDGGIHYLPLTNGLLIEFLKSDSDKEIQLSPYRCLRFLDKFEDLNQDIYVVASRIIFDKRAYSPFIVCILFHLEK